MLHTHLHLDVARTRQAGQAYTVFLRTLQSTGQKATLVCILEGLTGTQVETCSFCLFCYNNITSLI